MKKKSFKRIIAIVLSICCILTEIPILAIAQTYDEWKDEVCWNGDFEAGYEGMDVYGWKMVPFTNNLTLNADSTLAYYATNHTLKTAVEENGNKAAQLSRNGGGYAAMTSQVIAVTGEQGYEISLDYKTIEVTATAETNTQFSGINLVVQQLDGEGNETTELKKWTAGDSLGYGQTVSNEWSTLTQEMIMESDTKSIIVYIAIRGQWNARAKVLIDNVEVQQCDENNVLNGDFECTSGIEVDGWKLVKSGNTGDENYGTDYTGNYQISTEQDSNRKYMVVTHKKDMTQGYAVAQSSYIPVVSEQDIIISFDIKTEYNTDAHVPKLVRRYYDADKNYIGYHADNISITNNAEWVSKKYVSTAREKAAYMTVNFYAGGTWGKGTLKHYIDNVNVVVDNGARLFNGNGEYVSTDGTTVLGWSMTSTNWNFSTVPNGSNEEKYTITRVANGSENNSGALKVICDSATGNAALTSTKVNITPGKTYDLSYIYKLTDMTTTSYVYNLVPFVIQYKKDGTQVGDIYKFGVSSMSASNTADTAWTQYSNYFTAEQEAAYCQVYIGTGGSGTFSFNAWFDDIRLTPKPTWTSETTQGEGIKPRSDSNNFTGNYDMTTVHAGEGHEEAYKLYVKRANGGMGVVTYFSEAMDIIPNKEYTTSYDLKIEGVDNLSVTSGATYMVRYIKADGSYIMNGVNFATDLNGHPKTTDGIWKSYEHNFTTPSDAVKLQIGLCIGVSTQNTNKDMAYYYDNIVLEQTEVYEKGVHFPLFEGGDIDAVEGVDVRDLVHYKGLKAEKIEESFNEHADMNKNSKYDNDDQTLLMWKLIGKY